MKDVIERMLKVEEGARAALAEAKKQAAETTETARREAAAKSEAIRRRTREETAKRLETSKAELDAKRKARLEAFARDDAAYVEEVRPRVAQAAETAAKRVLGG